MSNSSTSKTDIGASTATPDAPMIHALASVSAQYGSTLFNSGAASALNVSTPMAGLQGTRLTPPRHQPSPPVAEMEDVDDAGFDGMEDHEKMSSKKKSACPKQHQLPMFLSKTYHMIDRCDPDVASWSPEGDNFVVKNVEKFASTVLPQYFKHSNFSSFARQLNFYGFRKLKAEPILTADFDARTACYVRFYHEKFRKDRPELLQHIRRATKSDHQSKDDVDGLKLEIAQMKERMMAMNAEFDRKMSDMSFEFNRRITVITTEFEKLAAVMTAAAAAASPAAAAAAAAGGQPMGILSHPAPTPAAAAALAAVGAAPAAHLAAPPVGFKTSPDMMQSLSHVAAMKLQHPSPAGPQALAPAPPAQQPQQQQQPPPTPQQQQQQQQPTSTVHIGEKRPASDDATETTQQSGRLRTS